MTEIEARSAWGYGLATLTDDGTTLDVWYPNPMLGKNSQSSLPPADLLALEAADSARSVRTCVILREINLDNAPTDAGDVYLRLHLLSHRLITPHSANLDGIFGLLSNVVWTNFGPCSPTNFQLTSLKLRQRGPVVVYGIDKFPRMVDYVVPSGVRIADADRVRLGAYLAEGTTVMHEGFCNFNAGTLGVSMVEGRISAGVVIGDGSDVGGGASIMGTLSGGGTQRVSLGKRSLLGANAGLGIALGDDCVVEAGLYITAGSKVTLVGHIDENGQPKTLKARELSAQDNLLFRRNSLTGAIEVVRRKGVGITLNESLHSNS